MFDQLIFVQFFSLFLFIGCVLPIILKKYELVVNFSLVAALVGSLYGVLFFGVIWLGVEPAREPLTLWTSNRLTTDIPAYLPSLLWEIRVDTLSAFFGFLITAFSALVAIYSFGALKAPHYKKHRFWIAAAFNLFVWSTVMVVVANDVFTLIIMLEIMTLSFSALSLYKHILSQDVAEANHFDEETKKNARIAPQVYLIISHTSTAFLLIALLLLAIPANSLSFDALRERSAGISLMLASVVFLLALVGLGIRAGLTPAHFWVSLVHPSSPTTTHAFSLGIAIKVAIYLMLRIFFEFLEPQAWWGYLLLLVAGITAAVNVWYAIASHDLKTALAYHSIENIGIICVGIAIALVFASQDTPPANWIAALALTAALYHLVNHAVFKGLLYLATGSVDNLTRQTVTFHKLGGLIKKYPITSSAFLIGAISISGFPPFNGFVSEWLTLQSLLKSAVALKTEIGIVFVLISLVLLVASFALTAFCFYKIFGLSFLGEPRTDEEMRKKWAKRDVPWTMGSVMFILMLFSLGLGLFPGQVISLLGPILRQVGLNQSPFIGSSLWGMAQFNAPAEISSAPLSLIILPMLLLALILAFIPLAIHFKREPRHPKTLSNCGSPYHPAIHQYTGAGLSERIRQTISFGTKPPAKDFPNYLPAHLILSKSERSQWVIELFRAALSHLIGRVLNWSERIGEALQKSDIRQSLRYIFWVNITILILFLIFTAGR